MPTNITDLNRSDDHFTKAHRIITDAWANSGHLPEAERLEYIAYGIAAYFRDADTPQADGRAIFLVAETTEGQSMAKIGGDTDKVTAMLCRHLQSPPVRQVIVMALAAHAQRSGQLEFVGGNMVIALER